MERKEIGTILEEEFEIFLKQNNFFDKFINNELLCSFCNNILTKDNISAIFFDKEIKFCCNSLLCIDKLNEVNIK